MCSYTVTTGTSHSVSTTHSVSVSLSLTVDYGKALGAIFKAGSVSLTTGYDWSKTTDVFSSEDKTLSVDTSVEAGKAKYLDCFSNFFILLLH